MFLTNLQMVWGFYSNMGYIFYCALGVIVFGLYLVFDTQQIVGGKRFSLDYDDYIIGAIFLYIDIIRIFLFLIQIISRK